MNTSSIVDFLLQRKKAIAALLAPFVVTLVMNVFNMSVTNEAVQAAIVAVVGALAVHQTSNSTPPQQ